MHFPLPTAIAGLAALALTAAPALAEESPSPDLPVVPSLDGHDRRVALGFLGSVSPPDDAEERSGILLHALTPEGEVETLELPTPEPPAVESHLAWRTETGWMIERGWARDLTECAFDGKAFRCAAGWSVDVAETATPQAAPDETAWADWTYSTELLVLDAPLFTSCCDSPLDAAESRKALKRAVELERARDYPGLLAHIESLPPLDWLKGEWHSLRDRAAKRKDHALVVGLYARLGLPMGRCSQDGTPVWEMLRYADACLAIGRTACFLNLVARAMGDAVSRVAWSTSALEVFESSGDRLHGAGVDPARFLLGLVPYYRTSPQRQVELGPWYLAAGIEKAGLTEALTPRLAEMIARPSLDELNRLRALEVLFHLRSGRSPRREGLDRLGLEKWLEAKFLEEKEELERALASLATLEPLEKGLLGSAWHSDYTERARKALHRLETNYAREKEERRKEREKARRAEDRALKEMRRVVPDVDEKAFRESYRWIKREYGVGDKKMFELIREEMQRRSR